MFDSLHDHFDRRGVCKDAHVSEPAREILKKKGLWDYKSSCADMEICGDPFDRSIDRLVVATETGGASGSVSVTAQAGARRVARFTWHYRLQGDRESWLINAERREPDGTVCCAETAYDQNGGVFDNISKDEMLTRLFRWMVPEVAVPAGMMPDWAGSFSAGSTQYALITIDDCVACDTPFCSC
jgi:hypothetical protein